ncbi:MAG: transporter substrate-binding domain-containing protein [Bacteroidetes bacterium]|nr:transporter substrate-binding domain-containing protein [Bacteroidota bacterium]
MLYKLFNKKIFLILFLILNFSSNLLPQVKNKLIYMGNYNKYPYEFIDANGKPEGFNIDVMNAIGKIMGFSLEFDLKPWNQVKDSVMYGSNFDISAMFYSEQREQMVDFSDPVIFSEDEIFIEKGSKKINSMIDLMNKRVAVEDGSFTEEYLLHNIPEINLIPVESEPDALKMVSENKCDAAVVEKINGERNIIRLGLTNIKETAYPMIPREYGFVVAKGNDSLLTNINVGLQVIKKNGTYAQLFNKWINPPPPKTVALKTIITWGIFIILILSLITGLIYFWIKSLRMLVFKKTIELRKEIEEHVKTEKELKIQKEKAEESDRLKSEFLAQISHEIRTPLNVILSYVSLIEIEFNDYLKDNASEIIYSINEASQRLLRTVTSILDMSLLRVNNYKADFEIININEMIEHLFKNFNKIAKKKKLNIDLQEEISNTLIRGDHYTTLKLFENIIDNSIKYTEKGNINIKIGKAQGSKITVEIRDTGIGIAKEYLSKIFEPFTQESTGDTRKFDGNGLGLALVKEYAAINNYEIKIESEKGIGTAVLIYLNPALQN